MEKCTNEGIKNWRMYKWRIPNVRMPNWRHIGVITVER